MSLRIFENRTSIPLAVIYFYKNVIKTIILLHNTKAKAPQHFLIELSLCTYASNIKNNLNQRISGKLLE